MSDITIHVAFRGNTYDLTFPSSTPLSTLTSTLEELTSVPPNLQKLLYRGKKATSQLDDVSLLDVGLRDGTKVQLLGSTVDQVGDMHKAESEKRRRDGIMEARARAGPSKIRSTGKATVNPYVFHATQPLPHLPSPHLAQALLQKLSTDPAILHIMSTHKFTVGLLTELAPHENPELLGLNQNKGEIIKLRLRTDAYDGMRLYKDVRRVLCHELTHNVWGDHDNNFKELNSQLNREVAAYETSVQKESHTLGSYSGAYDPSSSIEADALSHSHVLGGPSNASLDDSRDARRARVLEATLARLAREEKEIEDMCGSAGKQSSSS
ncbi:WLM-domain-containing protein [Sistotremastrum suecicum HHB10207 ss-3]|uniref:WLM-domain-containing protein n=1 Tax=Sistotremastrum suecicum HHB10207 ss-3 TaxID=1314776 RepID=A0A166D686_9AGAM|nr:WLM-domain-containing protein [Sistotremastrum suecicum HHB10207 ss-3]